MSSFLFCFTADDVCYEGYSTERHLESLVEFCGSLDVKATLFTVPLAFEKCSTGCRSILKAAASAGHEIAQHGLEHTRFEFGIPPEMVLKLPHEKASREYLAANRAAIEAQLSVSAIEGRLNRGRDILEQGLGLGIKGFRAPCLSVCENLFSALDRRHYAYDSSRYLQPAAWDVWNGGKDIKFNHFAKKDFDAVQSAGGTRELPLTAEYTWYLKKVQFDVILELAKHDLDSCLRDGIPFVPLSHVSPIQEGEGNEGFEFYRRLVDYGRRKALDAGMKFEAVTMMEACWKLFSDKAG